MRKDDDGYTNESWIIIALVLIAVGLALFATPARGQQHGDHGFKHSEHHEWYKGLMRPDNPKISCCSHEDCRPTETRVKGETVEAKIDGEWYTIPPEKILPKAAPDLGSHICAPAFSKHGANEYEYAYPKGYIFCAIIGGGV